jgi:hypothetical protein
MKTDCSFLHMAWKKSLIKIIDMHSNNLESILIFRTGDLKTERRLVNYLKSRRRCYFVRLGVICSMAHIEHDIAMQLNISIDISRYRNKVLAKISEEIMKLEPPVTIAIDNCHLLLTKHLFRIVMLMHKWEGVAHFIFLFPSVYSELWDYKLKRGDPHLKYFLKVLHKNYSIGQI